MIEQKAVQGEVQPVTRWEPDILWLQVCHKCSIDFCTYITSCGHAYSAGPQHLESSTMS